MSAFLSQPHKYDLLSELKRGRALKSALIASGKEMERVAKREIRSSGINLSTGVDKNIRPVLTRNFPGVALSAMSRGDSNMHRNRFGKLKPIPYWMHTGTKERYLRKGRRRKEKRGRTRILHISGNKPYRGVFKKVPYIERVKKAIPGILESTFFPALDKAIEDIFNSNG